MKYFIFTLGCQMNVSDSEKITAILDKQGLKKAPEKMADIIIVNACSVRQKAVDRIWGKLRIWKKAHKIVFLTGCILPADRLKFSKATGGIFDFKKPEQIAQFFSAISTPSAKCAKQSADFHRISPKTSQKIYYISIMEGCNNFCTYCAVPYTRGREISRPMANTVVEIKKALKNGYIEILLLGQNVNSYGKKLKTQNSKLKSSTQNYKTNINFGFIKLLEAIDNLPGNFKFNFLTSNPHDLSTELMQTLSTLKKWTRELHLPIQSGDDEILRKMNRKYTSNQFLELITNLKLQIPNIKISTDIIVGFPGETKKQFENTVKVVKKIGFAKAYISMYSPRPGTVAAKFFDNVSLFEKKRRWKILNQLINKK